MNTTTTNATIENSAMSAIVADATAAAKGKPENYSAETTAQLLAAYADGKGSTVEQLAALFGKSARSIVAKLSKEKVYTKKEYVTKAGTKPVSKEEHVVKIASLIGVESAKLESLEKANKGVLQTLETALEKSGNSFDGADTDAEKMDKAKVLASIFSLIGSDGSDLASLKYANKGALQVIEKALQGSAEEFAEMDE